MARTKEEYNEWKTGWRKRNRDKFLAIQNRQNAKRSASPELRRKAAAEARRFREEWKGFEYLRDPKTLQRLVYENPLLFASLAYVLACEELRRAQIKTRRALEKALKHLSPEEKKHQLRTWRLNSKYAIQSDPVRREDFKARCRAAVRKRYKSGKGLDYVREYLKQPVNKLRWNLRTRLRDAMRRGRFSKQTKSLVGCTYPELVQHLESLWQIGMSWDNYGSGAGKWHIDHKRPLASFDLDEPAEQARAFHFSNLQPLWAVENLAKNSFWNGKKHTFRDGKALVE